MGTIRLKAGHTQPVWAGHPWVYAQAIERVDGAPAAGDVVRVVDPRSKFLGRGFYSPGSAIPVRILERTDGVEIDDAWVSAKIERALEWRRNILALPSPETTGYRAVAGEGDGAGGLIIDVFGDVAAVQFLTSGWKRREEIVFGVVARTTGARTVLEIGAGKNAREPGLATEGRTARGREVSSLVFRERGLAFEIPREVSQKTGYYFDQRENRARVETLASGRTVLDVFAYVGSFGLAAARGGAKRVVSIESSAAAVAAGAIIARANGFGDRMSMMRADVKHALVDMAKASEEYDLVLVDPPKLVPTVRHLDAGKRAYRALNANALRLASRGAVYVTSSCSAALTAPDFLRTVGMAASDAGRELELLWLGHQAPDHPTPPAFAEGRYLKCAFFRVVR